MKNLIAEISLDKNNRLALGKVLKGKTVSSFEIYEVEQGYLLKPKVSIPAEEVWVFQNPQVKQSLQRGLSQPATHNLGSFAKFAEEE